MNSFLLHNVDQYGVATCMAAVKSPFFSLSALGHTRPLGGTLQGTRARYRWMEFEGLGSKTGHYSFGVLEAAGRTSEA